MSSSVTRDRSIMDANSQARPLPGLQDLDTVYDGFEERSDLHGMRQRLNEINKKMRLLEEERAIIRLRELVNNARLSISHIVQKQGSPEMSWEGFIANIFGDETLRAEVELIAPLTKEQWRIIGMNSTEWSAVNKIVHYSSEAALYEAAKVVSEEDFWAGVVTFTIEARKATKGRSNKDYHKYPELKGPLHQKGFGKCHIDLVKKNLLESAGKKKQDAVDQGEGSVVSSVQNFNPWMVALELL